MTQISGKIYQMKNAAGTENRFPRTVMEAVLGLNTYLQQQFSALADIYMPIEGISEALTNQEFVYRISPASIKAKSLTLDRILGRTLAWNQALSLSSVSTYWNIASKTISGNEVSFVGNNPGYGILWSNKRIAGHKYYQSVLAKSSEGGIKIKVDGCDNVFYVTSAYKKYGFISFGDANIVLSFTVRDDNSHTQTVFFKDMIAVDLTLLYGSEIDGMTDAEILAKFESEFPGYHDYSAGKLISNDAESIETVGFNQWDEEWELGTYINGVKVDNPSTIRCKNPIKIFADTAYYFNGTKTYFSFLDADGVFISNLTHYGGVFTTPSNAEYLVFRMDAAYGTTYNHDICINLSDASFNGQYEPYRKSTLHLGLNNIRVKSHNIWDEEWEVGGIDTSGIITPSNINIRGKNFIPVISNTAYFIGMPAHGIDVFFYDAEKNFISVDSKTASADKAFTTPSNCFFIKILLWSTYGTTYNHDICINVSSSFNGQYEPHGILTFNGVPSAGSVYDEIVGNKYVKRVGSVDLGTLTFSLSYADSYHVFMVNNMQNYVRNFPAHREGGIGAVCGRYTNTTWGYIASYSSNGCDDAFCLSDSSMGNNSIVIRDTTYNDNASFRTAMSGVMLNYELATPIEYELAEPLVPTVRAGTTEARISPNADGLSAPFRADITYSASENNDAATSQYAATAGRLINAQTIWGQTFDGSDSVSGAMSGVTNISMAGAISGVTNINSLINIADGNVGIGKAPSVKLDVNGAVNATQCALRSTVPAALSLFNTTSNQNAVYAQFYMGNTKMGEIGYWSGTGAGMYMQTATSPSKTLTLLESGGVSYNGNTIYHSGNSNLNTVNWTCNNLNLNGYINHSYHGTIITEGPASWTYRSVLGSGYDDTNKDWLDIRTAGENNNTGFIRLIANGNVGIGITSPSYKLDVNGAIRCKGPVYSNGTNGGFAIYPGMASGEAIRISTLDNTGAWVSNLLFGTVDGKVGLGGQSNPQHILDVSGTFRATGATTLSSTLSVTGNTTLSATLGVTGATTLSSTLAVTGNTTLSGNLTVGTSASEKYLEIHGSSNLMGKVYVGKDSASAPCFVLDADSQAGLKIRPDNAATTHYMHLTTGGVLTVTDGIVCNGYITAGASSASSDARLKSSISPVQNAIDIIMSLKPSEWVWNEKHYLNGQKGAGLVAQEVQSVLPFAVSHETDYLALNYNVFHAYEIAAIQYLVKRVQELESKLLNK